MSGLQGGSLLQTEAGILVLQRRGENSNIARSLCLARMERAFFSASADVLQHGILLPSSEPPGHSSNQIFLSPSCYWALALALMCPVCCDSQAHNSSFIFLKLKSWNIGISRTGI